jgi:hypothetical protein
MTLRTIFIARPKASIGAIAIFVLAAGALAALLRPPPKQDDVLGIARSLNGGGYSLEGTGVPEPVIYRGAEILGPKKKGLHCCGFTFWTAMKVAQQRGLLRDKEPRAVKQFQREWFGATKESSERQAAFAAEKLGIGRQIDPNDARPGDFVTFWRIYQRSGHSVVFLEYIRHDDVIVGVKYRSSQPSTDGIGDVTDYFASSGYRGATIDPSRFYVCRLYSR